MSKSKNKKTAQTNKMTAAWVDSMPTITISDDDEDEAAAAAPDNQPNDGTHPAAESAHCDAAKPFDTEEPGVKVTYVEIQSLEPLNAMNIEPSVETSMNDEKSSAAMDNKQPSVNGEKFSVAVDIKSPLEPLVNDEKSSVAVDTTKPPEASVNDEMYPIEMLPDSAADNKSPAQVPSAELHDTAAVQNVDNPTTMFMDTGDMIPAADVPVGDSVDHSTENPSVDIPVVGEGQILDSRSSERQKECSSTEQDGRRFYTGLSFCCFFT